MSSSITAFAKINLSLEILGRRSDGYHQILSLVAFTEFGDQLVYDPGQSFAVESDGPFAISVQGENLIVTAAKKLSNHFPNINLGRVHLTKHIPVAAGLGGGSADVAAFFKLVEQHDESQLKGFDWVSFGALIGADIPVCLCRETSFMGGFGEQLSAVDVRAEVHIVLVNPGVELITGGVFKALNAPAYSAERQVASRNRDMSHMPKSFQSFQHLINFLHSHPNDLTKPACRQAPVINRVLGVLERCDGCALSRLSGSGASCYGLFESAPEAQQAGEQIAHEFPLWWVQSTRLI